VDEAYSNYFKEYEVIDSHSVMDKSNYSSATYERDMIRSLVPLKNMIYTIKSIQD
jgi:hypothetical protein